MRWMAAFALLLALTTSCGSTGMPGASSLPAASATVAPTPAAPTPIGFTSDRYGYSLRLLPGWYVRQEASGFWFPSDLSYVGAGTDSFELDYPGRGKTVSDFPGVTYGLYISSSTQLSFGGAMIGPETTLQDWTELLAETFHSDSSCQGSPDREDFTVDGEPAQLLLYDRVDCTHDHHVIVVSVLHRERGFAMTWLARRGEDDVRRAEFEELIGTFEFRR